MSRWVTCHLFKRPYNRSDFLESPEARFIRPSTAFSCFLTNIGKYSYFIVLCEPGEQFIRGQKSYPGYVKRLIPRAIQCFEIQIFCIPWFSPESSNRNWKKGCNFAGNLSCNQCCRNCLLRHNLLYLFFLRCVICCATCVASANELFI